MKRLFLSTSLVALASAASADAPRVVSDIAPVHSLVAQVMGDLGAPSLLVRPGASPHGYAMRPSEAAALSEADLIVIVGERLTPWLMRPIDALGDSAALLQLLEVDGITVLETRTGVTFERHSHDHGGHDHDHDHDHDHAHGDKDHDHDHDHAHGDKDHDHDHDHAHGDKDHDHDHDHAHDDHDHDHDHAHDDHDHDHDHAHDDHDHDHDHGPIDSHAWLDPANAALWLGAIAEQLAEIDPANAETYRANAAEGRAALASLQAEIAEALPAQSRDFIVFHDAYQYFESRFGISAAGSISLSEATPPSAARVAELNARITDLEIGCVFSEPQMNPGVINALNLPDTVRRLQIDPLGAAITPGADHYAATLRAVADSFAGCIGD